MSVVAVGSVRSCGATTLALGLAATWPPHRHVLLVEADPAGGTLAANAGFPAEPSLVSLAAAVRRSDAVELATEHTHVLPGGAPVLTAPPTAEQSDRALGLLTRVLGHLGELEADVVLDCGRLGPLRHGATRSNEGTGPLSNTERLLAADVALLATRPELPDLHALGGFLDHPSLEEHRRDGRLRLVLVGSGPYAAGEIAEVLGVTVMAQLPFDRDTATALATTSADARVIRRSPLVRELRSLSTYLAPEPSVPIEPMAIDGSNDAASGTGRVRPFARVGSHEGAQVTTSGPHANGTSGARR